MAHLIASGLTWTNLTGFDRNRLRDALWSDFGPVCAYCQQDCQPTRPRTDDTEKPPPNEESIDHFRPRDNFRELQFDWLNLVYACYRCNQEKDGKWPSPNDLSNQMLAATYRPRYISIEEYVNPSESVGQKPAHEFFSWDFDSGEMFPSEQLSATDWSIARRTIDDIDLNHERGDINSYHPDHIFNQRRYHLYLFLERLESLRDTNFRDSIAQGFRLPDQPFFEFIRAYLRSYPDLTLPPAPP